ncbi:MAG: hypothetical protein KKB31_01390 [Nanoarchaeota archaeon]|nr:hypothetical protein [Nanoarchaeota archaeon]
MVSVAYSHRIICDYEFIDWLTKQGDKISLFSHLMHIKGSSEHWKKFHNLILKSELNGNALMDEKDLGAGFKIMPDPDFLSAHKNKITKNIIFAVDLADEKPFKCYILTSPENEKLYLENLHYKGVKSVIIVSEERARKVINEFFSAFCLARELSR